MWNRLLKKPLFPALILLCAIVLLIIVTINLSMSLLPISIRQPTIMPPVLAATGTSTLILTPTPTATITPRPTWTLHPTGTPTITPTPTPTATGTLWPTLTPAKPAKFNDLYQLRTWTASDANRLVEQLQGSPMVLFPVLKDRQTPAYDEAFFYATIAQREALLRFPDDPNAIRWRWGLAYHLARINDPQVVDTYAALVTEVLINAQIELKDLPGWFIQQEPRLELVVYPLTPQPGYLSSQIVEIKGGGGAFFWLMQTTTNWQSYALTSQFDFAHNLQASLSVGNLAGIGNPVAAISFSPTPGNYLLTPPEVFDLSQESPHLISFTPSLPLDIGMDFQNNWVFEDGQLIFKGIVLPSCPVEISRSYQWDEGLLSFLTTDYTIKPAPDLLGFCEYAVSVSAKYWGPAVTVSLMEDLLPVWPPKTNADGKPFPLDARDGFLFELGIYQALAGEQEGANQTLTGIITKPSIPASRWITPSKQFLATYQTPSDLYRACVQTEVCDPRRALKQIILSIPGNDYAIATEYLLRYGVTLRSSGIFDFENDGDPERWILVQHRPSEKIELFALFRTPLQIHPLFLDVSDASAPPLRYHDLDEKPPIVQIRLKEGFIINRVPETLEPYVTYVIIEFVPTTYTKLALQTAMSDLFSGKDPQTVLNQLLQVTSSGRFNCKNYNICDRFYYILGLANELSGHQQDAIDNYIKLWWDYKNSPLTIIARQKVVLIPHTTITPTPTLTRTITNNPTETPAETPTDTSTPYP